MYLGVCGVCVCVCVGMCVCVCVCVCMSAWQLCAYVSLCMCLRVCENMHMCIKHNSLLLCIQCPRSMGGESNPSLSSCCVVDDLLPHGLERQIRLAVLGVSPSLPLQELLGVNWLTSRAH